MKRWTKDRVGKIRVFLVFEDLFVDVGICKFFFFFYVSTKRVEEWETEQSNPPLNVNIETPNPQRITGETKEP